MMPHHVYYQLAILGCLWLCIMLHSGWPSRSTMSHHKPTAPVPLTFKRNRPNAPKPFEGLTQRPHCAACEHEAAHPNPPPPLRPHPMPPTNRRPRVIDTSRHFCPHVDCTYRGWLGLGNLRANGLPTICQPPFVSFLPHLHDRHWFRLMGICFPLPMNRLCHLHVENFARRQPPFDHSQSDSGDFSGRKMDAKKIVDYPIDM